MRLLLLTTLLLLGCGSPRRLNPCSPSGTGIPVPTVVVSLLGEPVDVELQLPPAVFCPEGNPIATDVVTEVFDAQNEPVPHEHTPPTSSNTAGYGTRIRFTPQTPGVFSFTARFEPALGVARRQLQVVKDRSAEAPALRATVGAPCDELWPLEQLVLCRRGTELSAIEDGGVLLVEPALSLHGAGPAAWVRTADQLTRFTLTDGGLQRAQASGDTSGAVGVRPDAWLQGSGTTFRELFVEDGGLTERTWSVGPGAGPISGPGLSRSGALTGWATTTQLCAGGPDAGISCVDSSLVPLVGEGDGLWVRGPESGVVALARLSPQGGAPVVLFVPAQTNALTDARQSRPVFSWNGRLVAVRADDLSFEAWRAPGPLARQSVNAEWVVFQLTSGEAVFYRR